MGQPQAQLNPNVDNSELIAATALANGTTNDAVMRFQTFTRATGTTGMDTVDTAADGSSFEVWRAGIYDVTVVLSQVASVTANVGISLNATNLTGEPVAGAGGVLIAQLATTPAATVIGRTLTWQVKVKGSDIIAGGGRARIRVHLTDGSGATGFAAITAATARVKVSRSIGLS